MSIENGIGDGDGDEVDTELSLYRHSELGAEDEQSKVIDSWRFSKNFACNIVFSQFYGVVFRKIEAGNIIFTFPGKLNL